MQCNEGCESVRNLEKNKHQFPHFKQLGLAGGFCSIPVELTIQSNSVSCSSLEMSSCRWFALPSFHCVHSLSCKFLLWKLMWKFPWNRQGSLLELRMHPTSVGLESLCWVIAYVHIAGMVICRALSSLLKYPLITFNILQPQKETK